MDRNSLLNQESRRIVEELSQKDFTVSEAIKILTEADSTVRKARSTIFQQKSLASLKDVLKEARDYVSSCSLDKTSSNENSSSVSSQLGHAEK